LSLIIYTLIHNEGKKILVNHQSESGWHPGKRWTGKICHRTWNC